MERWLSKITLAQTCYGHFYIEHNRGHHVRVATPEDPASARFGETFWEFLPRSVWGSLRSAWQLEAKRLRRADKSPWHWSNDVLNAWAMSVVFCGVLIAVFGLALIPFIVIQAVFGFTLLETVNYLEHYGLLRQKTTNGRYERCTPEHSWNSDHLVTNLFLYHLQRHSDHHANPTRRYQTLRSMDGAPNLPSGYASMIALTYFPPLWRKVMDHRVLEHYDGDITRVNMQPRLRDKMLARYGAGRHERLPLPGLRLRLRRSERRSARRISGGHGLGRCTRRLVLPRLRGAREGRLRRDGSEAMNDYKLFVCVQCGFEYDEEKGWPEDGIAPGTRWDDIPDDWSCPDCGAAKSDFEMVEVARP